MALALASLWPGSALGRSFLELVAALACFVLQLAMSLLALPVGTHALTPCGDMSPGHLQRLWLTASVYNALLTGVQAGGELQAAAGYMHEASLVGAVFSGAGESSPFLGDLIAHLPSMQATAASGINLGFWGPALLLLLAAVLPSATVRCCVHLGVGRRSLCTRCLAPKGDGWTKPKTASTGVLITCLDQMLITSWLWPNWLQRQHLRTHSSTVQLDDGERAARTADLLTARGAGNFEARLRIRTLSRFGKQRRQQVDCHEGRSFMYSQGTVKRASASLRRCGVVTVNSAELITPRRRMAVCSTGEIRKRRQVLQAEAARSSRSRASVWQRSSVKLRGALLWQL
jgi:hypothetical protein